MWLACGFKCPCPSFHPAVLCCAVQFLGLAWDIRLPSDAQKRKLANVTASGQVAAPEEEAELIQADSSASAAKQE